MKGCEPQPLAEAQGRQRAFRKHQWIILTALLPAALYLTTVSIGLHLRTFAVAKHSLPVDQRPAWAPPVLSSNSQDSRARSIDRGRKLFDETPVYAPQFVRARLSCSNCHAEEGMQPYAAPMVGLTAVFPKYIPSSGRTMTLSDRIQQCFLRSENGRALDPDGQPMQDLLNYIAWLSQPQPDHRPFRGLGFLRIAAASPNPARGASLYTVQCAGCHGRNGEGKPSLFPPLWGPDAYNQGAGMNNLQLLAEFVHHNMPQNRMGSLSVQQAYDVAAFVQAQPRPALNDGSNSAFVRF